MARKEHTPTTRRSGFWIFITAWWLVTVLPSAGQEKEEGFAPRPLSEAEIQAVQWVGDFFERGAEIWWPLLASDSPLAALGESAARSEIQVRAGLPDQTVWSLVTPGRGQDSKAIFHVQHPSGVDDLIELELVRENGHWKLHRLLSLADPRVEGALDRVFGSATARPSPSAPATHGLAMPFLWLAAIAAGCLWIAAHGTGRRRTYILLVPSALAGLLVAGCDLAQQPRQAVLSIFQEAPADDGASSLQIMTPLQPLRLALLTGRDFAPQDILALANQLDLSPDLREVAEAWVAQRLMVFGDLKDAEARLTALPDPSLHPLTELLRARLANLQGQGEEMAQRYATTLTLAPVQDILRLESALAELFHRREGDAETTLELLSTTGSRLADVYYFANRFATVQDRDDDADALFHVAWRLQPISRRSLFADPLLAHSSTRPALFHLFELSNIDEPVLRPLDLARSPLRVSDQVSATLLGSRLTLSYGADPIPSRLVIHGGAALAPPQTRLESAVEAQERETGQALDRLETLIEEAGRRERLAHPIRQRWAGLAAGALAEHHRWTDIVDLTRAIGDDPRGMSPELVQWRARALIEEGSQAEALRLVVNLAKENLENNRRDPGTYYQLAQIFVDQGEPELALRLIDRADKASPLPPRTQWKRQIELDRALSQSYQTRETDHFLLHFPVQTGAKYPRHLGWVLEAEWKRLQKWIPTRLPPGKKVEVQLVPFRDFMSAYSSGVEVVGIYDGKVRVPLADIHSLDPIIVGIVSHELAHAMIDIRTDGRAPKWLHEGLASHVEMSQPGINPIPEMHKVGRDLNFSIVDPVLAGFSEPQLVDLAYSHATWALHYVEATHGRRGIHRLLDAFRDGHDTEGAIRKTFGQSIEDFDRTWRRWCLDSAPRQWPTQLVQYEKAFDNLLTLAGDDGLSDAEVASLTRSSAPAKARKPKTPSGPSLAQQVTSWHRFYRAKAVPVKKGLRSSLAMVKGKKGGDIIRSCQELDTSIRALMRDPVALDPPLPQVKESLKIAYGHFLNVATACKAGQLSRIDVEIRNATQALGRAEKDLARFGVAP